MDEEKSSEKTAAPVKTVPTGYSLTQFDKLAAFLVCFLYFVILVFVTNSRSPVFSLTKTMLNFPVPPSVVHVIENADKVPNTPAVPDNKPRKE